MPRTCLGTRVLNLAKNPSSPTSNEDIGNASLLVECIHNEKSDENDHPVLGIKLLNGSFKSYGCTLSPSDLSCFQGEGPSSEMLLALGRLLLQERSVEKEDTTNSHGNQWQNKTTAFQYETNNNNNKNDDEKDLFLLVHESLSNGMKRRILRHKLERQSTGRSNSGLWYALAMGDALNRSLQETQQANSGRDHWKATAQHLDKLQQQTKDTLLENFTKLRNQMVRKHQREIDELQTAHRAEKEVWEKELAAAAASATTKTKQQTAAKKAKKVPLESFGASNELFADEQVLALAQGRKVDVNHYNTNKNTSGNKKSPPRKAVLKAEEIVDMVKIRREGMEFKSRNDKRKRTKKTHNEKEEEEHKTRKRLNESYNEKDSDNEDFDRKRKPTVGRKQKRKPPASPPKATKMRRRSDSSISNSSNNSSSNSCNKKKGLSEIGDTFSSDYNRNRKKRLQPKQTKPPTRSFPPPDDGSSSESSWVLR